MVNQNGQLRPQGVALSKLAWIFAVMHSRPRKKERMVNDGRRILESVIFQAVARDPAIPRICFVGCHRYSAWYSRLFDRFVGKRFETVDPDSAAREFGSSRFHHQSGFTELAKDASLRGQYDLIIISGVFGYGINTDADKRAALDAAAIMLRCGGLLLLGYRDSSTALDFDRAIVSQNQFAPSDVPGFREPFVRSKNENGVVYLCLRRN
jgi:hypothetical protein